MAAHSTQRKDAMKTKCLTKYIIVCERTIEGRRRGATGTVRFSKDAIGGWFSILVVSVKEKLGRLLPPEKRHFLVN